MAKEKRYFKLGAGASSFHDPKSGLTIAGKEVGEVPISVFTQSKALMAAKKNGHVVETDAEEFEKFKASNDADIKRAAAALKAQDDKPKVKNNDGEETAKGTVSPSGRIPGVGGSSDEDDDANQLEDEDLDEEEETDEDEEEETDEDDDDEEEKAAAPVKKTAVKKSAKKSSKKKGK